MSVRVWGSYRKIKLIFIEMILEEGEIKNKVKKSSFFLIWGKIKIDGSFMQIFQFLEVGVFIGMGKNK